jgi:hypothetical protein
MHGFRRFVATVLSAVTIVVFGATPGTALAAASFASYSWDTAAVPDCTVDQPFRAFYEVELHFGERAGRYDGLDGR